MATIDFPLTETEQITLTEGAVRRVRKLIEERELTGYSLRVFVSGGGCSGMQYGMGLESEPRETDLRFSFDDVQVVVDPMSITYLAGTVIDYTDELMGGGFKIENPKAVSACGCGHSFRTEESSQAHTHSDGCC
ncbi:MAG: iron-sulfur cluster insertion protein ErpA [Chloroflexota bacterium]|mgnify:FL=1